MREFLSPALHWLNEKWSTFAELDASTHTSIFLVAITAVIAYANLRLVRNSQAAHERDLRAYVTMVGGVIDILPDDPEDPEPKVFRVQAATELVNQGRTPAYKFRSLPLLKVGVIEKPLFDPRPPEPDDINSSIIGAGAGMTASMQSCKITQDELIGIWRGENLIFASLRVEYIDAFGKRRFFLARAINSNNPQYAQGPSVTKHAAVTEARTISRWNMTPHRLGYDAD
ncbi:MAG: hypothetical protein AAGF48_13620 [Pseudomonadota bacterium]